MQIPLILLGGSLMVWPQQPGTRGLSPEGSHRVAAEQGRSPAAEWKLSEEDLLAWCIVPFDSKRRSPEERIEMLKRLGFKSYAYDWRTEHLPETARELLLARESGVSVAAVWIWIDANLDRPQHLSIDNERLLASLKQAQVTTQFWVGFDPGYFRGFSEEESTARAAEMVEYLCLRAEETGSRVALYNHGDWFGEPENQIRIIQSLPSHRIGMVYNFHHGHEHISRFQELAVKMSPHLWAVNLNGMRPEGPKILPFGKGTHERWMLQIILDTGFQGPFGVLGHVENADVELVLKENLQGLLSVSQK